MDFNWGSLSGICALVLLVLKFLSDKKEDGRREAMYAKQEHLDKLKEWCILNFVTKEVLDLRLDPIEEKLDETSKDVKDVKGISEKMSGEMSVISRFIKERTR